jgi:hypothetical protein
VDQQGTGSSAVNKNVIKKGRHVPPFFIPVFSFLFDNKHLVDAAIRIRRHFDKVNTT